VPLKHGEYKPCRIKNEPGQPQGNSPLRGPRSRYAMRLAHHDACSRALAMWLVCRSVQDSPGRHPDPAEISIQDAERKIMSCCRICGASPDAHHEPHAYEEFEDDSDADIKISGPPPVEFPHGLCDLCGIDDGREVYRALETWDLCRVCEHHMINVMLATRRFRQVYGEYLMSHPVASLNAQVREDMFRQAGGT